MTRAPVELSIVIPAFNEARTLESVVTAHDAAARDLGASYEIVICNDGSLDDTGAVAEKLSTRLSSVRAIHHERNEGAGATLLDLYSDARGRWIYFTPADGQVPASELANLWQARASCCLVIGWRDPRRDPAYRVLMARAYSAAIRFAFSVSVRDIDGVKLYEANALRSAWPRSRTSFAEAEILVRLGRAGCRLREVRIDHRPRAFGRAQGASWRIVLPALLDFIRFLFVLRHAR